jgi:hypothetical protein
MKSALWEWGRSALGKSSFGRIAGHEVGESLLFFVGVDHESRRVM